MRNFSFNCEVSEKVVQLFFAFGWILMTNCSLVILHVKRMIPYWCGCEEKQKSIVVCLAFFSWFLQSNCACLRGLEATLEIVLQKCSCISNCTVQDLGLSHSPILCFVRPFLNTFHPTKTPIARGPSTDQQQQKEPKAGQTSMLL